jgi:hypothetical protein
VASHWRGNSFQFHQHDMKKRTSELNRSELPATITGAALVKLTGLTSRRLRQIAALGKFPEPKRDRWQTVESLRGLFDYYRSGTDEIRKAKLEKLRSEVRLLDQTHQERDGALVNFNDAVQVLSRGHSAMTSTVMGMTDLDIEHREAIVQKIRGAMEMFSEQLQKETNHENKK